MPDLLPHDSNQNTEGIPRPVHSRCSGADPCKAFCQSEREADIPSVRRAPPPDPAARGARSPGGLSHLGIRTARMVSPLSRWASMRVRQRTSAPYGSFPPEASRFSRQRRAGSTRRALRPPGSGGYPGGRPSCTRQLYRTTRADGNVSISATRKSAFSARSRRVPGWKWTRCLGGSRGYQNIPYCRETPCGDVRDQDQDPAVRGQKTARPSHGFQRVRDMLQNAAKRDDIRSRRSGGMTKMSPSAIRSPSDRPRSHASGSNSTPSARHPSRW